MLVELLKKFKNRSLFGIPECRGLPFSSCFPRACTLGGIAVKIAKLAAALIVLTFTCFKFTWGSGTTGVFSGRITDEQTGKGIDRVFITAQADLKTYTTISDSEGFFAIAGMLSGNYRVSLERVDYRMLRTVIAITPDATTHLDLQLSPNPLEVPGVTVLASEKTRLTPAQSVTNYAYSNEEIQKIFPGPAGLNVRALVESFPGVQIGYDAYYGQIPHIRGGSGYDVGYSFDGVPTYNNITYSENNINSIGTSYTNIGTSHTDVYVGAYPVQYGNFISGFINQIAKRGVGPLHGRLEYQYGLWLDRGGRLPTFDSATGNLSGYPGQGPYSPTNINFELQGQDRRFSYYFNHIIQDRGVVAYAKGVDIKPLINELGGGLLNSVQQRDTVLNLNYNLNAYNDLQLLFYTGFSKLNYAGFAELPCNPTTFGCVGTSTRTGFGESFNAYQIAPLSDMHDHTFFDLEKFEWAHRFKKSGSLLTLRLWRYNPGFYLNRFDLPSTLWEFERSSTQGILLEHQNQITRQHLVNAGGSFSYSKNYFLSSSTDIGLSGTHFNSAQQIVFGRGPGQSLPGVANIILVPDTQNWSAWITDQWRPDPKWLIEGGLRWDRQNTLKITGPGIVTAANGLPFVAATFCTNQGLCLDPSRFNPSWITPRAGVSYQWSDDLTLKAGYGKFVTFPPARRIESVRYSSTFSSSSVYLPGFPSGTAAAFQLLGSKPQFGETIDFSLEYKLDPNSYLKITPYIKHIKDPLQIAIVNGFPFTTNAGTIESKGIEFLVKTRQWHGISGWLSYTLSSTRGSQLPYQTDLISSVTDPTRGFTQAEQISQSGQMVPTAYDQRHLLSVNVNIKHGPWEIAPNFTYGSGYPYGMGVNQLSALAALLDPQSYVNGGTRTVQQSVAATTNFNPLGEKGFNSLRMPGWWLGNLAVTYHVNKDTSIILNVFNLFNSSQIINVDNTVLSGIGYGELTNPNAGCCYTSNDSTQRILPQYNPINGQYAPIAYPNLRQFYLTLRYNL